MSYISTVISWFLEHFTSEDVSIIHLIMTMVIADVNAVYLFLLYRLLARKSIYSKYCGIAIASATVVTTAMIYTVSSSVVLSLGMVGALAIVRFRSAMKDPLDIVFLFWAVSSGVCCGAGMVYISILLSAFLTILLFFLEGISIQKEARILILEVESSECETQIWKQLRAHCKKCRLKNKTEQKELKLIFEIKTRQEFQLIRSLEQVEGVKALSLILHEGEHNY